MKYGLINLETLIFDKIVNMDLGITQALGLDLEEKIWEKLKDIELLSYFRKFR